MFKASSAGSSRPELLGGRYPKIQILTIEDLLNGKAIDYPRYGIGTFKKARLTSKAGGAVQADLFGDTETKALDRGTPLRIILYNWC